MSIPVLETPALILRPVVLADAPRVEALLSVFEVADTTLNIPHPYPAGGAAEWITAIASSVAEGTQTTWAIVPHAVGELCGVVGLHVTPRHNHAELGYWIGLPYWNRGYATAAVGVVIAYGFDLCQLHRIFARHFLRNLASGRVMQKNGMTFEGVQRQHLRRSERYEDVANYGILRDEWLAGRDVQP